MKTPPKRCVFFTYLPAAASPSNLVIYLRRFFWVEVNCEFVDRVGWDFVTRVSSVFGMVRECKE